MELRRRQLDRRARALRRAEAIAFFFPGVRARGPGVDAVVEELAHAHESRLAEACDNLPDAERRRIVDSWTTRYPERWAVLVGEARDLRAAERALVVAAIGLRYFARCRRPLLARVAWVRAQLPFRSFPAASEALRDRCDLVATKPRFGEELACAVRRLRSPARSWLPRELHHSIELT